VVYPPPPERPYRTDGYGEYVFAVSRLTPLKRLDLLIEAAARMRAPCGVKIAGEGEELGHLRELARARGIEARVEFLGAIDEARLVEHYARCRAVFFAPHNEDYGFVTLEAFRAGKAVVTARDSGGPAELVEHGGTGFVGAPDAAELAGYLDALAGDRALAERLGAAARREAEAHTWERVMPELLIA
jgi:glycosyltransferase involved in cell wall biosynthesis